MTKIRLDNVLQFATDAHKGQVRKYTGEDYITHPIAVMDIVSSIQHTPEMLAAALLHDVVEDTDVTFDDIITEFGHDVFELVYFLTDQSKMIGMRANREFRKKFDADHYARGPAAAQTVKVADLIHNTATISTLDPKFWDVYKHEKKYTLDILVKADPVLLQIARSQLEKQW